MEFNYIFQESIFILLLISKHMSIFSTLSFKNILGASIFKVLSQF